MSLNWRKKTVLIVCDKMKYIYLTVDCAYGQHSLTCPVVSYGKLYIYYMSVCRIYFYFFWFEFNVMSRNSRQHFRVPQFSALPCVFSFILIVPSVVTVIQVLGPQGAVLTDGSGKALNWKMSFKRFSSLWHLVLSEIEKLHCSVHHRQTVIKYQQTETMHYCDSFEYVHCHLPKIKNWKLSSCFPNSRLLKMSV